jgi:peptidase inhibitor family I36
MSRTAGLAVAVVGLLTAVIGLVSSPIWGPHVCHAIGVCNSPQTVANNNGNAGGNANGGDNGNGAGGTNWTCPGGQFCAWDGLDGSGTMIVEKSSGCSLYDIGSAGSGDRIRSAQNRTGTGVGLYNWTGQTWARLQYLDDGFHDNVQPSADKQTDAVKICDTP